MEKNEIKMYIKYIKKLADELQKHAEQVSSDKYGSQEYCLKKAWSHLEVLRQDYFPEFDYEKAMFARDIQNKYVEEKIDEIEWYDAIGGDWEG